MTDISVVDLTEATDEELADMALEIAFAAFGKAFELGVVKRNAFHGVIMNQNMPFEGDEGFRDAVLAERTTGSGDDYKLYGRSKSLISWRMNLTTREVNEQYEDHLLPGDTNFWGSAVIEDDCAGGSGVQSRFDEAVMFTALYWYRALREERDAQRNGGDPPKPEDWVGGKPNPVIVY